MDLQEKNQIVKKPPFERGWQNGEKNMKLNKKWVKAVVFALMLSFAPVFVSEARAEGTATSFEGSTGLVSVDAAKKVWSFAKIAKTEKNANLKLDTGSTAGIYTITEVNPIVDNKIDLSFAKKNKEILLAIGKSTDIVDGFYKANEWEILKIAPENGTFKVQYVSTEPTDNSNFAISSKHGYIVATDGGNAYDLKTANKAKVEVRTESSDWATLDKYFLKGGQVDGSDKLEMLTQSGAKLFFRIAGTTTTDDAAGTWPSKEVSIKIAAQDKAPKISVNNAKAEINFKKDTLFNTSENTNVPSTWKTAPGKVSFNDASLNANNPGIAGDKTLYLFVKNPANGKKIESKLSMLKLTHQDKVTVTELTDKQSGVLTGSDSDGVSFSLKIPYDLSKGGTLSNTSAKDYEVLLTGENTPPANAKWLTLKAKNKKGKAGKLNLKYSADNKLNTFGPASHIFIRLPGDKKPINNELKMYSPASEKKAFVPVKVTQTIELPEFTAINYTVGTEAKLTGTVTFKKLYKDGLKLKVKVEKAPKGVKIKLDKLKKSSENGTAKIELVISKNAVKKAADMTDREVVFELSGEGAAPLKTTVTITPKDK